MSSLRLFSNLVVTLISIVAIGGTSVTAETYLYRQKVNKQSVSTKAKVLLLNVRPKPALLAMVPVIYQFKESERGSDYLYLQFSQPAKLATNTQLYAVLLSKESGNVLLVEQINPAGLVRLLPESADQLRPQIAAALQNFESNSRKLSGLQRDAQLIGRLAVINGVMQKTVQTEFNREAIDNYFDFRLRLPETSEQVVTEYESRELDRFIADRVLKTKKDRNVLAAVSKIAKLRQQLIQTKLQILLTNAREKK